MITDEIKCKESWLEFLAYKIKFNHINKYEEKEISDFINEEKYLIYYNQIIEGVFPCDFPKKILINKEASEKKRIVYSFNHDENIILKYIAHCLSRYDYIFSPVCYSFRRNYGIKNVVNHFKNNLSYTEKYCFKGDLHNYFNSIDVNILLKKLEFLKIEDLPVYNIFNKILLENSVYYNGRLINDSHGAMAGIPVSPFFANLYLTEVDNYFYNNHIEYYRYSDDILIFANTENLLKEYTSYFFNSIKELKLDINPDKAAFFSPGDNFDFLGFSYNKGNIDISANTLRKVKGKIKRKANALRKWQRAKNLTPENAAVGFIRSMNKKFFGKEDYDDFSWNRWFFPNITTDYSLKIIDAYMQEYIRYIFTGRHYKGNYRITYEYLKSLDYRSLVNEYYKFKEKNI